MRRYPLARYVLVALAGAVAVWLACQYPKAFDLSAWVPAGFFS